MKVKRGFRVGTYKLYSEIITYIIIKQEYLMLLAAVMV